jgi:Putative bacterial sensory transduction regulator
VAAIETIDAYVQRLPGETRRLADAEWGITVAADQAAGWPLDVGLRIEDGILRVQAFALSADDAVNPWNFLHWNRGTRYIRFACTQSGDIWVHADLPVAAVDDREVDRLLGLVAEGALAARNAVADRKAPPPEDGGEGWGALR